MQVSRQFDQEKHKNKLFPVPSTASMTLYPREEMIPSLFFPFCLIIVFCLVARGKERKRKEKLYHLKKRNNYADSTAEVGLSTLKVLKTVRFSKSKKK